MPDAVPAAGRHARSVRRAYPRPSTGPGTGSTPGHGGAAVADPGRPIEPGRWRPAVAARPAPLRPRRRAARTARRPADEHWPTPDRRRAPLTPVLTRRWASPRSWSIGTYRQLDGYQALRTALAVEPDRLIELVKNSGLRGRGGAGFPTGLKWSFLPQGDTKPHYLVINADEGEPGTCKDIPLMMADPHSLIEGCIITSYAIRAPFCAIYVRGEAVHAMRRRARTRSARPRPPATSAQNILGSGYDLEIVVHGGAGAYICGEETALLDSLEGRRGQPRLKPPFPAVEGLYACPTVVNNVETIASRAGHRDGRHRLVPVDGHREVAGPEDLLAVRARHPTRPVRGADGHHPAAAAGLGRRHAGRHPAEVLHPGRVVDADLHPRAPGRAAVLRRRGGRRVDARHHRVDVLQRDRVGAVGGVEVAGVLQARVLWQVHAVPGGHLLAGRRSCAGSCPAQGTLEDLDTMADAASTSPGRSFCALGDAAATPILSSFKYFRSEFEDLVTGRTPPVVESPATGGGALMTQVASPPAAAGTENRSPCRRGTSG